MRMFEQQPGTPPQPPSPSRPPGPTASPAAVGTPPPNLPVAGPVVPLGASANEPEDILSSVEPPPETPVTSVPPFAERASRGNLGKKIAIAGGAGVVVVLVGVVVWFTLFRDGGEEIVSESAPEVPVAPAPEPPPAAPEATTPQATPEAPPVDTDGDGLSDAEETTLGTNVAAADTDGDGLSDRDEVRAYGTDPRNPDTDDDGYQDGQEVRSGYDPKAKGKRLFEVPPAK